MTNNLPSELDARIERIRCSQCELEQDARVVLWDGVLYYALCHTCTGCGYVIMESEWERVDKPMTESVHIFSNGTEHDYWRQYNCEQRPHSCHNNGQPLDAIPGCKIETALMLGVVTRRQRWFAGYERPGDCTTWRCRYRQQLDKRAKRKQAELRHYWVQP